MPPRIHLWLVVAALALPVVVTVIAGAALLLGGLGDEQGAGALRFTAVATGIVWVLDLIALVLLQAVQSLGCQPVEDARARRDSEETP